jgi:hypothetical protein
MTDLLSIVNFRLGTGQNLQQICASGHLLAGELYPQTGLASWRLNI